MKRTSGKGARNKKRRKHYVGVNKRKRESRIPLKRKQIEEQDNADMEFNDA